MPEGMNVEVAHKLSEHETPGAHRGRWHELVEVVEVAILAIVAVATAWSGLQAAKWDGRQSLLYGKASSDRFQADAASTLAGLQLSADASMFTGWLQARAAGDTQLQTDLRPPVHPRLPRRLPGVVEDRPVRQPGSPARPRLHALIPQSQSGQGQPA